MSQEYWSIAEQAVKLLLSHHLSALVDALTAVLGGEADLPSQVLAQLNRVEKKYTW